jgi:hypothetical protein
MNWLAKESKMKRSRSKPAICCKCGKNLGGHVPKDAEDVTCFACCEVEYQKKGRR